jgi:hypothetical protein
MHELLGCVQPPSYGDTKSLDYKWKELDFVAANIDRAYCSPQCPCALTNTSGFEDALDIQATYSNYTILSELLGGKLNFQNCSVPYITKVQYDSSNQTLFANFSNTIKFWHVLEDTFNCTGWCQTTYKNYWTFNETLNTCMNPDKITPCNCTDYNGKACSSCVDKSDNRSLCNNYIRSTYNIEKYLFSNVNKYINI